MILERADRDVVPFGIARSERRTADAIAEHARGIAETSAFGLRAKRRLIFQHAQGFAFSRIAHAPVIDPNAVLFHEWDFRGLARAGQRQDAPIFGGVTKKGNQTRKEERSNGHSSILSTE